MIRDRVVMVVLTLVLTRTSLAQDWGLALTGGWASGQWLSVSSITHGLPAHRAGLEAGDSLVQVEGQLVIFLDMDQVNHILQTASLSLSLTVQRWEAMTFSNNFSGRVWLIRQRSLTYFTTTWPHLQGRNRASVRVSGKSYIGED